MALTRAPGFGKGRVRDGRESIVIVDGGDFDYNSMGEGYR